MSCYSFNGWGVTTVDSLDTMWLMGGEVFASKTDLICSFISSRSQTRV